MSNVKEIDRNSNSSFIRFRRRTSPTTDLMYFEELKCRVSIVSKVFTSFSFSKCDTKTRINKGYTSRKTHYSQFEQTLKLFKCEKKVNYLYDLSSPRPSI